MGAAIRDGGAKFHGISSIQLMPRRAKRASPRRLYIPETPPESVCWLESDRYDRQAWGEIRAIAPSLAALSESGGELIPHFDALLEDLFLAAFKYNLVWQKPGQVRRSALLNRAILEQLLPSPAFEALKSRTLLEEDKAAIAAIVLGERVLETIRSERLLNRREMLDLWDLARQEDELRERAEVLKSIREMTALPREGEPAPGEESKPKPGELAEAAERAARVSEAQLNQKARIVETSLKHGDMGELKRIELGAAELSLEVDRAAEDSHAFSREFGQGGRMPAGQRIELGRRLAQNRKLGELARLVGRFKQDARALKRRTLERGAAETYDVERGSELGRIVPSELAAMHHPVLGRDFRRRLLEGALLQYRLRQDEQKGRGPMVVCIDVSSSMGGQKELWSKAVALTLMDIARRRRRLFRAVMFSCGEMLKVLDLNPGHRHAPDLNKVLELAEYFPGGGTDFERPLDAALELLEQRKLKRGDIVIITDGECQVGSEWLARLQRRKEELQFSIFAVLVDVGSSELSTLARFSDRVTSVKKLTAEGTRDIFLKIQEA